MEQPISFPALLPVPPALPPSPSGYTVITIPTDDYLSLEASFTNGMTLIIIGLIFLFIILLIILIACAPDTSEKLIEYPILNEISDRAETRYVEEILNS